MSGINWDKLDKAPATRYEPEHGEATVHGRGHCLACANATQLLEGAVAQLQVLVKDLMTDGAHYRAQIDRLLSVTVRDCSVTRDANRDATVTETVTRDARDVTRDDANAKAKAAERARRYRAKTAQKRPDT